ncbi:hypothetical protein HYR99_28090 [Candidatus Poribacteria bacterium]|nr:hypothetical protein [Candidatus Poribacteria bacterium]
MPTTNFPEYAHFITDALNAVVATGQAKLVNLQIDQRSMLRGFISGRLLFDDNSELHFREFVDLALSEPRLMYAYHYQDANKGLIFRYDNAPHRPPLSQAEHEHTPAGIILSLPPTLVQIIDQILKDE